MEMNKYIDVLKKLNNFFDKKNVNPDRLIEDLKKSCSNVGTKKIKSVEQTKEPVQKKENYDKYILNIPESDGVLFPPSINIDEIKRILIQIKNTEVIDECIKKYRSIIDDSQYRKIELLKTDLSKMDYSFSYIEAKMSENLTNKYVKIIEKRLIPLIPNLMQKLGKAIRENDGKTERFVKAFITSINCYLQNNYFFTPDFSLEIKWEDYLEFFDENSSAIKVTDHALNGVIKSIERMPYEIKYFNSLDSKEDILIIEGRCTFYSTE